MGIGSLVGALLVATKIREEPKRRTMFASSLVIAALLVMVFFIHSSFLTAIAIAGIGFFNIIFMNTVNATLQLNSSDEYRGRTMSVYALSLGGTTPIGNLFAGGFTQRYGPSVGFLMCGAITGILILAIMGRTRFVEKKQSTQ